MNADLRFNAFELWHVAGWTMLHFLWLGTLVGLAGAVLRIVLRRAPANARYAVAMATFALLAIAPLAIAAWLIATAPTLTAVEVIALQKDFAVPVSEPLASEPLNEPIVELSDRETPLPQASPLPDLPQTPLPVPVRDRERGFEPRSFGAPSNTLLATAELCVPYLPWVWLIGAPITFAVLATGLVGTRRLRRASRAIGNGPINELLARLCESMRIGTRVSVAVCERVAAPVLIGIVRPIILLPPAAITGWSTDEIEMVLLHELAHVRRWDNAVNLAQRIVESLLFFHPAVWLVSNWIRREREACCDAVVVDRTNRPHAYAELLVALAAQMPRSVLFHPAASSAMAAGPLRKRIHHILQLEDDPMLITGKSFLMVLAALLVAATLAVLYLPSIGQAEESAAEAADLATEDTEVTETNAEAAEQWEGVDEVAGEESIDAAIPAESVTGEVAADTEAQEADALISNDASGEELIDEASDSPDERRVLWSAPFNPYSDGFWDQLRAAVEQAKRNNIYVDMIQTDGELSLVPAQRPTAERWPSMLGDPPRKDRVIAEKGWQRLGLKLVPSSTLEKLLFDVHNEGGGVKIIGGNVPQGLPLPAFLKQVGTEKIVGFDDLHDWLDGKGRERPEDPIKVYAVADGHEYLFEARTPDESQTGGGNASNTPIDSATESSRAGNPLNNATEPTKGDPHTNLLVREIADLRLKRAALEKQLIQLQTDFAITKSRLEDPKSGVVPGPWTQQLTHEYQTLTSSLQQQLAELDEAIGKATETLASRGTSPAGLETHAEELLQRGKFPSLEEQKLADLGYKRLGLELEQVSDDDLQRVKALGYEGGVKVAFGRQLNPENGQYGSFELGDILVGLHVWPTTNLQQVAEIFDRDDLAELNPVKFYVVRRDPTTQSEGGGYPRPLVQSPYRPADRRDIVVTGRITVRLEPQARVPQPPGTASTMRMPWELDPPAPKTAAQPGQPPAPGGLKVYFFHSEDSAPSRDMKSVIERIAAVPPGAEVIEIDVDKKPGLAKQMNITHVPTCVFMRDGTELGRIDGAQTEHELRNAIRTILKTNDLPTAPTATVPPRLLDPNDRTEMPADGNVKTFDAESPADEAVKGARKLMTDAGIDPTAGPVEVEVIPHDGGSAPVVRGPAASKREAAPKKESLSDKGKSVEADDAVGAQTERTVDPVVAPDSVSSPIAAANSVPKREQQQPRSSLEDPRSPLKPASNDRIFIVYTIPEKLRKEVEQYENVSSLRGIWDEQGRFVVQARPEEHDKFKNLLDATPKWRQESGGRLRMRRNVGFAVREKEGTEILEWPATGLTFARETRPEYPGIVVVEVDPGSPAAWQDIQPGYIMTHVDGFGTRSLVELASLIETLMTGFPGKEKQVVAQFTRITEGRPNPTLTRQLPLRFDNTEDGPSDARATRSTERQSPTQALQRQSDRYGTGLQSPKPSTGPDIQANGGVRSKQPDLRYEGKTFDEWREAWRTELSTEKRIEAVKALAAFGSAGSDAIEPPDILMINAVKIVPKPRHSIEPFDGLLIRVDGVPADAPIADAFVVDPEGKVDLGPKYGSVSVRGMSTDEAKSAIQKHLVKRLTGEDPLNETEIDSKTPLPVPHRDQERSSDQNDILMLTVRNKVEPFAVAVSLAFSAGAQQIVGEHLVGPDGNINLGTYGSVHVAGKTIDEARKAIEAQLANYLEDPAVTVDYLAKYGPRSYAREAAEAILEISRQYDWRLVAGQTPTGLHAAILEALFGGSNTLHSIPARVWFPLLMESVRAGDKSMQQLMHAVLLSRRLNDNAEFAIEPLLELTQSEIAELRLAAVRALSRFDRQYKNPRIVARLQEMLNSDDPQQIIAALESVRFAGKALPFDATHLLFHADASVQRYARRAIQHLRPQQDPDMVEFLLKILADPNRTDDYLPAIRALCALDDRATSAYVTLEKLAMNRDQPMPIRIAAAVAAEQIMNNGGPKNRLQQDVMDANRDRQETPEFRMELKQLEQAIDNERRSG